MHPKVDGCPDANRAIASPQVAFVEAAGADLTERGVELQVLRHRDRHSDARGASVGDGLVLPKGFPRPGREREPNAMTDLVPKHLPHCRIVPTIGSRPGRTRSAGRAEPT